MNDELYLESLRVCDLGLIKLENELALKSINLLAALENNPTVSHLNNIEFMAMVATVEPGDVLAIRSIN